MNDLIGWREALAIIAACLLFVSIACWIAGIVQPSTRDLLSGGGLFAFGALTLLLSRIRN